MRILVDLRAHRAIRSDAFAEVNLAAETITRIKRFEAALKVVGGDVMGCLDKSRSLTFRSMGKGTRGEVSLADTRLGVDADGHFWWEGFFANRIDDWRTDRIAIEILESADQNQDLRFRSDQKRCFRRVRW